MKKIALFLIVWVTPLVSLGATNPSASNTARNLSELFSFVLTLLLDYVVPIIMGLAVVVFLWGILKFITKAGDEGAQTEGKQLMLWGIIALFVMTSVWGLVHILTTTFGLPFGIPNKLPATITP